MLNIFILATICLPWIGAVIIWLCGDQNTRLLHILAVVFSLLAGLAAVGILPSISSQAPISFPIEIFHALPSSWGSLIFIPDAMGVLLTLIATWIGSLAIIFSVDYMQTDLQVGRYYSLILIFIGAMSGLALTGSLLFLFFFWEITALCSYALISYYNDDPKAVAGGLKALFITQLGGVGLLAGALIISANLGSYDIANFLQNYHAMPPRLLAGVAFGFLIASAAKSAQVPFQTWLPDAMEAPTPVSALIHAATMVNAGIYLLFRFYPAFSSTPGWKTTVMIVGLLTAFLAALMAAVADDLKRILAYSTVSQLGFMVYAIGLGSVFAAQFHLFSHAVFKALLFLSAGAVIHSLGTRQLKEMGGLSKEMPFVRNAFLIGALALAGIPILNGFWSKELILEAGLEGGPVWAYVVMLITAGITAFYATRMFWLVFLGASANPSRHVHDAKTAMRVALFPLAVAALTTWVLSGPLNASAVASLPYHNIHLQTTLEISISILQAPSTWVAILIVFLGVLAFLFRNHLNWFSQHLHWLKEFSQSGFGFEKLNQLITHSIQSSASLLRKTQTGQLNWNLASFVFCMVIFLIIVVWRP